MAKLVTIFGGSGFVGRHVAQILARQGWRIRIAVRHPDEALFTRTYGAVGQVVPVLCNIRDAESVRQAMADADAVVNCVNLPTPKGKSTFQNVLEEGAANIARISAEIGVQRIVHVSGIGVDPNSASSYIAAKARGEASVLKHRSDAVILRPSVIFGSGDVVYNRFASLSRLGPVMPIIGGNTRIQPVHVEDVALAAVKGVTGEAASGIYELGGPDILTVRQIVNQVLETVLRRRLVIGIPFWMARIGAGLLNLAQTLTGGLFSNTILNNHQIELLRHDNIVNDQAKGFGDLGIVPTAPAAVIGGYLWRFRPSGQYDEIKRSAKNLRSL